ncbi:MAG: hypothetical protein AAB909_00875 [Patescibacteria group bacterium]
MRDQLKLINIEDFDLGFNRLKNAKLELSGDLDLFEYQNAEIGLADLTMQDLLPCSYYALKSRLEFQREYRERLLRELGLDLFRLPGIAYIKDGEKVFGLVPPFVESYPEESGEIVSVLQDGVHRFLLSAELGIKIKCILIKNVNCDRRYLPYAHPNSWEELKLIDELPSIKKRYRREPKYSFMRPLSSIFDSNLIGSWADYGRK